MNNFNTLFVNLQGRANNIFNRRHIAVGYVCTLYGYAIFGTFIYGAKKGIEEWVYWKSKRPLKKSKVESVDNMINVSYDGSMLTYYIMSYSFANAFVALTFPISTLVLKYCCNDQINNVDDDNSSINSVNSVNSISSICSISDSNV